MFYAKVIGCFRGCFTQRHRMFWALLQKCFTKVLSATVHTPFQYPKGLHGRPEDVLGDDPTRGIDSRIL
jgi:hypothetical protein